MSASKATHTYPDWIPIEGLLPRRGERHGDDTVYRASKDAKSFFFYCFFIIIIFNLKMYFPDMHIFLNSYSMQTPACDIGKIKVKSILLITPLVFRNLKNKQFFQCSFLMPTLTLVTVQLN